MVFVVTVMPKVETLAATVPPKSLVTEPFSMK